MSIAAKEVLAERQRQIKVEGGRLSMMMNTSIVNLNTQQIAII